MSEIKFSPAQLQIMEMLWRHGPSPIRDIQERFPEKGRPAYTTVQTLMHRLEAKGAVSRVKKIGSAFIFEATVPKKDAAKRRVRDFLSAFRGSTHPLVAHFVETGKLTWQDVEEAEALLRRVKNRGKPK